MPELTDRAGVVEHFATAIAERKRYLFVTDNQAGHLLLAGLAAAVGLMKGSGDLYFGSLGWQHMPSRQTACITWLTIPKTILSVEELDIWMKAAGLDEQAGERDLIAMGTKPELLGKFMQAMADRNIIGEG